MSPSSLSPIPRRNLGDANYNGLSCPYILPESAPDQPSYFLNWSVTVVIVSFADDLDIFITSSHWTSSDHT